MSNLTLYKTLSREIVLNGQQHSVQVTISTAPEDDLHTLYDQDFDSPEHKEAFREKLNSGILEGIGVIVKAQLCGEVGTDSLWACIIGDGYTVENIVEEHGMIKQALLELENNLSLQYRNLKVLFGDKS